MISLNNEINSPVASKQEGSARTNKNRSPDVNQYSPSLQSDKRSKKSEQGHTTRNQLNKIQISKSNDVSDLYRVINSDIQYRNEIIDSPSSHKIKIQAISPRRKPEINETLINQNRKEYMKKNIKKDHEALERELQQLDFQITEDNDIKNMKDHSIKLKEIRVIKEQNGIDPSRSTKETPILKYNYSDNSSKKVVTLAKPQQRLSMQNDFTPDLDDHTDNTPSPSNKPFIIRKRINSIDSTLKNEKRFNGSFHGGSENDPISRSRSPRSRFTGSNNSENRRFFGSRHTKNPQSVNKHESPSPQK